MEEQDTKQIFKRITERYQNPIRVGSRCEANTYYRVEDLTEEDVETCGEYIVQRVQKVCHPNYPSVLIRMPGSYTGLATYLSKELAPPGESLQIITLDKLVPGNGVSKIIKNTTAALVNDVITTARSCIEAHTRVTMMGGTVLCWLALIDRTFGPGPVPVITAFTGEPVTLLEKIP